MNPIQKLLSNHFNISDPFHLGYDNVPENEVMSKKFTEAINAIEEEKAFSEATIHKKSNFIIFNTIAKLDILSCVQLILGTFITLSSIGMVTYVYKSPDLSLRLEQINLEYDACFEGIPLIKDIYKCKTFTLRDCMNDIIMKYNSTNTSFIQNCHNQITSINCKCMNDLLQYSTITDCKNIRLEHYKNREGILNGDRILLIGSLALILFSGVGLLSMWANKFFTACKQNVEEIKSDIDHIQSLNITINKLKNSQCDFVMINKKADDVDQDIINVIGQNIFDIATSKI